MTTVVFVAGTGHCGSTLVDLILGSHSRALSLGQFSRAAERLRRDQPVCSVCPAQCPLWDRPDVHGALIRYFAWTNSRSRLLRSLFWRLGWLAPDIYGKLADRTGCSLVVDSSKSLHWIQRQLRSARLKPGLKTVVLYVHRDGRAVVNSVLRKYPDRGIEAVSREWAEQTRKIERFLAGTPADRQVDISYEWLASDPERRVAALCDDLGLAFEPAMLRYWSADHHLVSGNAGTASLIFKHRQQDADLQDRDVFDENHYENLGLSIELDQRWHDELPHEHRVTFERVAGAVNQRYVFAPGKEADVGVEGTGRGAGEA